MDNDKFIPGLLEKLLQRSIDTVTDPEGRNNG
ncbi:MAG: hypothetical protein JWO06_1661, partial [Bacteroidota bacterium]|nr:hypothetical protein [Bacteroidota bacterium]